MFHQCLSCFKSETEVVKKLLDRVYNCLNTSIIEWSSLHAIH